MKPDEIRDLMMKVVDGIASAEEQSALEEAIRGSQEWETELRAFKRIKDVTDGMRFKELPDSYWPAYWEKVYRRLERGAAWILTSLGAIILLSFGSYVGLSNLYSDPNTSIVVKIGVTAAGLGIIIMLVSFLRERLFARKHERYEREVQR